MVIIEAKRSYYITIGDNYISISIKNDSYEEITEETVHIVDDKLIDDLEELIDTQMERVN